MNDLSAILVIIILLLIYFTPSIIAIARNHGEKLTICLINVILGLTGIGWIVCLIWSITDSTAAKLKQLKEKEQLGLISHEACEQQMDKVKK